MKSRMLLVLLPAATLLRAAEEPSAAELAGKLAEAVRDGTATARLRMEYPGSGGEKTVLQIQADTRRTVQGSAVRYRVLWPKDRPQGSFVLTRPADGTGKGMVVQSDGTIAPIGDLREAVLGSSLTYEDLVGNYFAWADQRVAGKETVDRIPCIILESRPGSGDHSAYASVRTWIDPKRLVPLQVEKYDASGRVVRRVQIDRVTRDDRNVTVPAAYIVESPGGPKTLIEGSTIRHGVALTDADFSAETLQPPPAGRP